MSDIAANAMQGVTTVFTFITTNAELAAIALGFPFCRGAVRVVKRLVKL